mmetsp:Transcript_18900/g.56669  ORF Transcript_18900/g.56669 Transcript_18900/m.56669 type:complete len:114 (-) Transcript_18900:164-505(-)
MTKISIVACMLVVMANCAWATSVPTKKEQTPMAAVQKGIILNYFKDEFYGKDKTKKELEKEAAALARLEKDDAHGGPKIKGTGNMGKSQASAKTLSQAVALVAASAALAGQLF